MCTPRFIGGAGGLIDRTRVTLCVYSESLEPDVVTAILGVAPDSSHRKGDRRGPRRPPFRTGGWFYGVEGTPPEDPSTLTTKLLDQLPGDAALWLRLASEYDVRLSYGLFLDLWNRGISLPGDLVARIARLHVLVEFDIYAPESGEGAGG
jgi:Domain of unknown function (DUF4279)